MNYKLFLTVLSFFTFSNFMQAQDSVGRGNNLNSIDLSNRANDHFMVQYGFDGWSGAGDSINVSGFSRHFNFYFMLDKPFKTNPHFSVGLGLGLGSSNIFFSDTYIDIKANTATLPFKNVSSINHFNKYKLTTLFLEVPLELRVAGNPMEPDKGFKLALGVKGGFLLNAYTKGKDLQDSVGNSIYGDIYKSKEYDKKFINSTRFAATARIGFGNISVDGSYQFTEFLKQGTGPQIHPWSIGITLSGL